MSDAYVVIRGDNIAWAIDAHAVREIQSTLVHEATHAIDVGKLWGAPLGTPSRVIVIDDALALAAPSLAYRQVERSRVLPLPREWEHAHARRYVAGIIFEDEGQPLVVLDLEGLRHDTHE